MMHSQMPVQSLLCALLMLPLGVPQGLVELRLSDQGVQQAAAFAVQEYNNDQQDAPSYFKKLQVVYAQSPVNFPNVYHLTVALVKTACLKRPGTTMAYVKIQQCPLFPGHPQVTCYFKITSYHGDTMSLDVQMCLDSLDREVQWSPEHRHL
ncbi:cystatin-like [Crotalus tigris]|uniref:cystatin-like n=1 Tax=Crotalus tigris TaxID=88082 RepID=UPI00192F37AE|nr:cystatin-like [Crotalus tigris]